MARTLLPSSHCSRSASYSSPPVSKRRSRGTSSARAIAVKRSSSRSATTPSRAGVRLKPDQLVADLGVDRERVAVDLRHDRVEVHAGPLRRHRDCDHAVGCPGVEQPAGQQLDAGGTGSLAHADQHAAVPDHEHVAALELGRAAEAVAPGLVLLAREQRVVAVDGVQVDRLAAACRLRHLVHRHAAVHPRRRIAREEVIRKRREHEPVERRGLRGQRAARERKLVIRDAADQALGQLGARRANEATPRLRARGSVPAPPGASCAAARGCGPPGCPASRRAARAGRAPPHRARQARPRTRRAPAGRGVPRARRRTAARPCCAALAASARGPAGEGSPGGAGRSRSPHGGGWPSPASGARSSRAPGQLELAWTSAGAGQVGLCRACHHFIAT